MAAAAMDVPRTDEQKTCRKIVIRTGLRIAQKSGFLLVGGIAVAGVSIALGMPWTAVGCALGAVLILVAAPLISTGKNLARMDSPFLAAIDEPKRIDEVHIAATQHGGRQALAIRLRDESVHQVALLAEEVDTLRAYFKSQGVVVRIVDGNSVIRSIRPNLSKAPANPKG